MDEKYVSKASQGMDRFTESQIFYYIAYPFRALFTFGEEVYDDKMKDDVEDWEDWLDDRFTDLGGYLKEIYVGLGSLDIEGIKNWIKD